MVTQQAFSVRCKWDLRDGFDARLRQHHRGLVVGYQDVKCVVCTGSIHSGRSPKRQAAFQPPYRASRKITRNCWPRESAIVAFARH